MFFKFSLLFLCLRCGGSTETAATLPSSPPSPADLGCYVNNVWYKQMEQGAMDEQVDPCTNFHTHACGMWRVPYDLRAHSGSDVLDTLSAVRADNHRQLIAYFDMAATRTAEQQQAEMPAHRLALVRFYDTCLDATQTVTATKTTTAGGDYGKLTPYTQQLLRISNNWPIIGTSQAAENGVNSSATAGFHWEHVVAEFRRYGVDSLWRVVVQSNWQAAEQQILYIVPPAFDLLRTHASATEADESLLYLYKYHVKRLMLDLGTRVRKAIQLAEEIVGFEQELLALASSSADTVVLSEPQTLASLAREFPDMRLWQYFNALLYDITGIEAAGRAPTLDMDQVLVVANKRYLRKLSQKLRNTSVETLAKWLLVQFFAQLGVFTHMGISFKDAQLHCLRQLNKFLPNELTTLFLELQPHGGSAIWVRNSENDLKRLFEEVKVQFEVLINETTIFNRSEHTKAAGLDKLRAMRLLLPPVIAAKDLRTLGFDYEASYHQNLLNFSQINARNQFAQLLPNSIATMSSLATNYGPLQVNAYYRLKKNAIELPIGLLRAPFYDSCLPEAKIYGSLVYILAHELLHGFDYDGLNYDESGSVVYSWDAKSIIQYGKKSSCYFGDRYSDAALKINENIADSEGLRLALGAFKQRVSTRNSTEALKLFFLSFAQTWCSVHGDKSGVTTEHAASAERVNNALSNFDAFAAAYQCRNGSYMHPSDKCRIW